MTSAANSIRIFTQRLYHERPRSYFWMISMNRSSALAPSDEKLSRRSGGGSRSPTRSGHSKTTSACGSLKNSSGLSVANSSGTVSRYASMCTSFVKRPKLIGYDLINTYVGLWIVVSTPSSFPNTCTNVVLPAPRSPWSVMSAARKPSWGTRESVFWATTPRSSSFTFSICR